MAKINKYFKTEEFQCKCGCDLYIYNDELINILTMVRIHFGVPVKITSSTRCKTHNKNVGGADKSKHKLGMAADIQVKGIQPEIVARFLINSFPDKYGIGLYNSFTHIDVRSQKARW